MKEITSVEEIKEITLNILSYLDEICQKYHIKYFMSDGTLLGAVRHKGFIPWDDDIDVWIPRADYDRLEKIVNEQEHSHFRVMNFENTKGYVYGFAKLVDTRTRLIEDIGSSGTMGVYVDLFPYDGLPGEKPEDFQSHVKTCLAIETQRGNAFRTYKQFLTLAGSDRSLKKFFRWAVRRIVGGKRILKVLDKKCRKYPVENNPYVGCLCAGYKQSQMIESRWIEKTIRMPFEGRMFNAPADYDSYLKVLFGDYMQLPPEEERVSHHFYKAWWVDKEEIKCQK